MANNDDTVLQMMNSDEDVKIVVASLVGKVKALEARCDAQQAEIDENKRITAPLRWLFNKVMAGVGLALVAGVLAWLGIG